MGKKDKKGGKKGGKKGDEKATLKLNPYTIKTDEVLTVLQLVNASEEHVIFLALCELDMFINKYGKQGIDFLEQYNSLAKIVVNLDKSRNTKLMTMKILIKMLDLDNALPTLTENSDCFDSLLKTFKESDNNMEIEYSGNLLSAICENEKYAELISTDVIMARIFDLLVKNVDPDIKKFCLKLLYCIVTCETMTKKVAESSAFKVSILNLVLEGPFKALRSIIVDIFLVISNNESETMQKQLFQSNSIVYLFDVILEKEWTILEQKVVKTILNCIKFHPVQTQSIETKKFLHLVKLPKGNPDLDPNHVSAILSIIIKLADVKENLQAMVDFRVYELLHEYCKFDCDAISVMFCDAISIFAKNCHIIKELANKTTLREIERIMRKTNLSWIPYRQAGIKPLYIFAMNNPLISIYYYKYNIITSIQDAVTSKCRMSGQYYKMALEIFQCMLRTECLLTYLWNADVYNQFVILLNDFDDQIIQIAIDVLQNTLTCESHRRWFLNFNGVDKITKLLSKPNSKHLNVLLYFLKCASYFQDMCVAFFGTGIINAIVNCGNHYCHLKPLCDSIMADIYRFGLSTKFYETGFLDYTEKTRNGFCVCTRHKLTDENNHSKLNTDYTVLTVNFHGNKNTVHSGFQIYISEYIISKKHKEKHIKKAPSIKSSLKKIQASDSKQGTARSVTSVQVTEQAETTDERVSFPPSDYNPMPDYFLKKYLEAARNIMSNELIDREEKIRSLAKLVVDKLSGYVDDIPIKHQFETHISEVKKVLQSNYIPIGYLQMGTMLERAVLFKVLADRVDLPCSLKRGKDTTAWNEIWHGTYFNKQAFLPKSLHSHYFDEYVVDLMINIGNLMPKGSNAADFYCSLPSTHKGNNKDDDDDESGVQPVLSEFKLRTINY